MCWVLSRLDGRQLEKVPPGEKSPPFCRTKVGSPPSAPGGAGGAGGAGVAPAMALGVTLNTSAKLSVMLSLVICLLGPWVLGICFLG